MPGPLLPIVIAGGAGVLRSALARALGGFGSRAVRTGKHVKPKVKKPTSGRTTAANPVKPTVKKPTPGGTTARANTPTPKPDSLARAERGYLEGRVTWGELQQERLVSAGHAHHARVRADAFNKSTANSARSLSGTKVKGLQKSPGKPTKAVRDAMKPPATEAQKIAAAPWRGRFTGKPKTVTGTLAVGTAAAIALGSMGRERESKSVKSSSARLDREHRNRPRVARPAASGLAPYGLGGNLRVDGTTPGPSVGRVTKLKTQKPPGSGSSGGRASGAAYAGKGGRPGRGKGKGKPMPTVSQSRTMWVKKGETVGGQVVKKGYLAQYGKAEKRVSAKVNIVTDTESGKKAGETYKYKMGRSAGKVKKKK